MSRPVSANHGGRDADATIPVRTVFLKGGTSTTWHRHDEHAAWIHVIAGELAEERFRRDHEGGYVRERRVLREGQSMAAPADMLHRVTAENDATFVMTSMCDCGDAREADAHDVDVVLRLARTGTDLDWASTTTVGGPAPLPDAVEPPW